MLNQKTVYKVLIRSGVMLLALVLIGLASSQAQARRSADLIAQGRLRRRRLIGCIVRRRSGKT